MKRTKILATLGPASHDPETVHSLSQHGVSAFRINTSHGNVEQWTDIIRTVREVVPDALIILDTQGPEMRLLNIEGEKHLQKGDSLTIHLNHHEHEPYLSLSYIPFVGQKILIDDGAISTHVTHVDQRHIIVEIENVAILTNARKVTISGASTEFPALTTQDKEMLLLVGKLDVEAVALSFARRAADVQELREIVGPDTLIIAKIENSEGVSHIDEILHEADGIMVARGDLGVEMSLAEVPMVQKRIVRLCNRKAKPVIVATQMLESMIHNQRPTRAEASDVANAIIDGADCLMLSAETAIGSYPVEAVQTMAQIAGKVDPTLRTDITRTSTNKVEVAEAISNAVYDLSVNLPVQAIVSATSSGFTARMVARFRPDVAIIGVAHDTKVMKQLQLTWGVTPCTFSIDHESAHRTIFAAVKSARDHNLVSDTDTVIATAGIDTMQRGSTNLIEVHNVGELMRFHHSS